MLNLINSICDQCGDDVTKIKAYIEKYNSPEYEFDMWIYEDLCGLLNLYLEKGWLKA